MGVGGRIRDDLAALVTCESPSPDQAAIEQCTALTAELGASWLGKAPETVRVEGHPHLLWTFGERPRILLLGHYDTVWPLGTIERWPFSVEGDRATGPGIFDMKAGVIQAFLAVSRLADRNGVAMLLTSDEEVGSPTSRALIEDTARGTAMTLVLEASVDMGALKLVRKGVSIYGVDFHGRAAHAGLEPEKGANAVVALSHWVTQAAALADPALGTTVTPSVVHAGTAVNTVPNHGWVGVDVRVTTVAEQERVERGIRAIQVPVEGVRVDVGGGPNRPPLEAVRSAAPFALAQEVAAELGLPPLRGTAVGGGSDGNLTAGIGVDTLDGLGAVGEHAHGEGEWASLSAIDSRGRLVTGIIQRVLG